ncbi:ribonuclease HII [Staphylococcus felis]|uniref:ribonuclease HII n=1 Tax=Staphylococcus felis TaxID=46127 RepID=UPI000CD0DAC2|nr:ribonuclease HII [Staphylococcus felis]AVP36901.1 ribonuclease HII [Staphylococcus felis]PNZ35234.1 ribonuclease HII [Staphylococcus felis]QQB03143.1 ribonuclease HII [Staphylococcus felis]
MAKTVKMIREELSNVLTRKDLSEHPYANDSRKGVQQAFRIRLKQIERHEQLEQNYIKMCRHEDDILKNNPEALICGIDEVGRGPLAGPVVASAVILDHHHRYIGINDSKQLSSRKREDISQNLKENVKAWSIGVASPEEIDQLNIYEATKLAMYRAIAELEVEPTHYLIDAMTLDKLEAPQHSIIKGDASSVSIAAASIIAKVYRDTLMKAYNQQYPGYDFAQNAGYGTAKHLEGLELLGCTPIHRNSFEPIKSKYAKKS